MNGASTFVPNYSGGVKLQIVGKKTLQVHLIIIREWPKNHFPILRNLDNLSPGAFYLTPPSLPLPPPPSPPTIRHSMILVRLTKYTLNAQKNNDSQEIKYT